MKKFRLRNERKGNMKMFLTFLTEETRSVDTITKLGIYQGISLFLFVLFLLRFHIPSGSEMLHRYWA